MRIAIASGKGGAGKTMVASSLSSIWDRPCIVVDADVEAPNLHLFLHPRITAACPVYLEVPLLNKERCTLCGACRDICRYKAIAKLGKTLTLFPDMCHGCGGCFAVCPEQALEKGHRELGSLEEGTVNSGSQMFLMGRSRIGEAMTPPQLRALHERLDSLLAEVGGTQQPAQADALIDAPPGVSCPAMAVARDADMLLLVAEPTPFGFHDFILALEAFTPLGKPMAVIMNRAGMRDNTAGDDALRSHCRESGIPILAEVPFARELAEQYAAGKLAADLSADWKARFIDLRETLKSIIPPVAAAGKNVCREFSNA